MSETAVADAPQVTENPAIEQPKPRFNPAMASINGKKGGKARIQQILNEKKELLYLREQMEIAKPILQAAMAQAAVLSTLPEEKYRIEQLIRTRKALDALWVDLEKERDPKSQKALCDSIARLSDVEFALARRPKPAAYRTAPEKPKRAGQQSGPVDAD